MKFGFGHRNNSEMPLNKRIKNPTADEFRHAYEAMRRWHAVPETGVPKLDVFIHSAAFDWAHRTAIGAGVPRPVIWEVAIQMAGFNLLAAEMGLDPYLAAPRVSDGNGGLMRGERHNLPPLLSWRPNGGHVNVGITPSAQQFNVLKRYVGVEDAEIRPETLIDNGVRIMGALALMPEGSAIAVRDNHDRQYGIRPLIALAGADPYPADLGFDLPQRSAQ